MNDVEYQIRFALPADFDALYRARHHVYVETDGYFEPRADRKISDRFDGADETYQVIAEIAGRVIGGARSTTLSARGLPAIDYYDFGAHLPAEGARIGGAACFSSSARTASPVSATPYSCTGMPRPLPLV